MKENFCYTKNLKNKQFLQLNDENYMKSLK